jgi:hypothetical protein
VRKWFQAFAFHKFQLVPLLRGDIQFKRTWVERHDQFFIEYQAGLDTTTLFAALRY